MTGAVPQSALWERFKKHLALTSDAPVGLEVERAEGVWLFDPDGNRYFDAISGIAVNNLGHNHPAVDQAVRVQLNKYDHALVFGEAVLEPQVQLAEKLAEMLPEQLSVSYFVNSGSEAVEGAIKLAKRFTGRSQLVSFEEAYHGSTVGALSLCSAPEIREGYEPLLQDVVHLPFNSVDTLERITEKTAGVVVEPIQGEAGVIEATSEFLHALRRRCSETGALLIFDEVQTGFGRTGKMFAFEHYHVVPDVLVLGKAIANGLPLSAFVSAPQIMNCLKEPELGHMTTFGGSPVACAAALAVLEVMTERDFMAHVLAMGDLVKERLKNEAIKQVRGRGLMLAVELDRNEMAQVVCDHGLEKGVVLDWFLFARDCLRLYPPLTATDEEVAYLCEKLNGCI